VRLSAEKPLRRYYKGLSFIILPSSLRSLCSLRLIGW
jgi:hypothetical protein